MTFGALAGGRAVNGAGAAGLATVVGSAKLGAPRLGGEGGAKGKNGFCAGTAEMAAGNGAETAAGNGGGPFDATNAAGTAVIGNGGGPLRTGAAAGTATAGAGTDTAAATGGGAADTTAAAGRAATDTPAAPGRAGEGCKAAGLARLGRGGGAAGFTGPELARRG